MEGGGTYIQVGVHLPQNQSREGGVEGGGVNRQPPTHHGHLIPRRAP